MTTSGNIEHRTGEVFGKLWPAYDEALFEASVQLFSQRIAAAGFEPDWFAGKRILDAGCGGGRNALAMARYGAEVVGVDLSEEGLHDARRRAAGMPGVSFLSASLRELPFADAHFDMVWCSGVLMHTVDPPRVLDELARVLKPGGLLYLLVYATGGLRWPLVKLLRPLAAYLGMERLEAAVAEAGLAPNKRRTFLDDLFTPLLDFYAWHRLSALLESSGFDRYERWGRQARLDHEASLTDYRHDLEALCALFEAGARLDFEKPHRWAFAQGAQLAGAVVATVAGFEAQVATGVLSEAAAMDIVVGQGHHRVMARRA